MKKIIGITGLSKEVYGVSATVVLENYVELVRYMGCIPMLLPLDPDESEMEFFKSNLSALILQGGYDIHPFYSNEDCMEGLGEVNLLQDKADFRYLEVAYKNNIPVLGICRGMQVINVFFGGTLYQDTRYLKRESQSTILHNSKDDGKVLVHEVFKTGYSVSSKRTLFKNLRFRVNSLHHEHINKLGEGLMATLESRDGAIEGIELKTSGSIVIGVQFHPEIMLSEGNADIKYFVDQFKSLIFNG